MTIITNGLPSAEPKPLGEFDKFVTRVPRIVAGREDGSGMAIVHGVEGLHVRGRLAHPERALLHGDIGKLSHQYRQHPARLKASPI